MIIFRDIHNLDQNFFEILNMSLALSMSKSYRLSNIMFTIMNSVLLSILFPDLRIC